VNLLFSGVKNVRCSSISQPHSQGNCRPFPVWTKTRKSMEPGEGHLLTRRLWRGGEGSFFHAGGTTYWMKKKKKPSRRWTVIGRITSEKGERLVGTGRGGGSL